MCVEEIRDRAALKGGPDARRAEACAIDDRLELLDALDELETERETAQKTIDSLRKSLEFALDTLDQVPTIPVARDDANPRRAIKAARKIIDAALDEIDA